MIDIIILGRITGCCSYCLTYVFKLDDEKLFSFGCEIYKNFIEQILSSDCEIS